MPHSAPQPIALISVSNKDGLPEFVKKISKLGYKIVSTGRTASLIEESGIDVTRVSQFTEFPEMMDGRLKTLHPRIFGGILADRSVPEHLQAMEQHDLPPIDLVCVNLYPFEEVTRRDDVLLAEAIENIDIGGPSLLRAAAKNYEHVLVVCDVADYDRVADAIATGTATSPFRRELAAKVFARTRDYDTAIASFLTNYDSDTSSSPLSDPFSLQLTKVQDLRYGENPHQQAAFYVDAALAKPPKGEEGWLGPNLKQLQGKELSYNNLMDLDAALRLVGEFSTKPAVAVIKHTNPSGCATAATPKEALEAALACDPVSAFGSIVAFNRPVDSEVAELLTRSFYEIIVAPAFDDDALAQFSRKKNLRVLVETSPLALASTSILVTSFGTLVQTKDPWIDPDTLPLTLATEVALVEQKDLDDLIFAWKVCKHVKSNAIVLARNGATIGLGAGQMSRVDSVNLAVTKAVVPVAGSVLASDAFFPFADGPELAAKAGVKAIIQPGGSKNDSLTVDLCNQYGVAMYLTGERHFKH